MKPLSYILIPGRHHVLTNFQYDYLKEIIDSKSAKDIDGNTLTFDDHIKLVWAVTSANHSNTRRNPISGNRREIAIERFGANLAADSFVYLINDLGDTDRFADYLIKDITVKSRGLINMTPENTVVACSTPAVIEMYESLGYKILPLELVDRKTGEWGPTRAWQVVEAIAEAGADWRRDSTYLNNAHTASKEILEKYCLGDDIVEIFNDPILGDEGDITETRDYEKYVKAFDDGAERKYDYIRGLIRPGRIVDIGCATGSIIKAMSFDDEMRESDLYGIEVTRKMYEMCEQRKAAGDFGNENVFFYQRNILAGKIFPDNSINTTTAFSLTHEIESYVGRNALKKLLQQIYRQTAIGGAFINYDVVGPKDKDKIILLELNRENGADDDGKDFPIEQQNEYSQYLESLSTFGRFKRFARDFRAQENEQIKYEEVAIDGKPYFKLKLQDAAEFLSKMNYIDSWYSEMHEKFCYWSFDDWKQAVADAGFEVDPESYEITNPWIVEHNYKGNVRILSEKGGQLIEEPYPPTAMVLAAEKKL